MPTFQSQLGTGWSLSPHHVYDPALGIVHRGDGGFGAIERLAPTGVLTTVVSQASNPGSSLLGFGAAGDLSGDVTKPPVCA